jgi:predicted aldo/keto reductase-like oxidoreductase
MRGRARDELDAPAGLQIDASLARLGLPYADAFVFHSVSKPEQWEALVRRGAFDELAECIRAGKARSSPTASATTSRSPAAAPDCRA